MSQYQLRVYTLCNPDALVAYENIWSKHMHGLAKHRITTHGMQERLNAYLSSREFRADIEGFDLGQIVAVAETVLTPTSDSPLR